MALLLVTDQATSSRSFGPRSAAERLFTAAAMCALLGMTAIAGTFGTVVPIGGHASDIAFDARRGVLYIANFLGNRIDVMSLATNTLQTPIRVSPQPGSIALSANGRYLAVTQYANFESPGTNTSGLTILDLDAGVRQVLTVQGQALTVEFGNSPRAFLVTSSGFWLVDPATGAMEPITPSVTGAASLGGKCLPTTFATFPPQILRADATVSGDGNTVLILADTAGGETTTPTPPSTTGCSGSGSGSGGGSGGGSTTGSAESALLQYVIPRKALTAVVLSAAPPLGPRVVSTDDTGSAILAGWGLLDRPFYVRAQFARPTGDYNVGSHVIDTSRNLIYGQIPVGAGFTGNKGSSGSGTTATTSAPELEVFDAFNLTVRERLKLAENLAGKSILSPDKQTMYSVSDSGVLVLPIGALNAQPRLASSKESLLFQGNSCSRQLMVQTVDIVDPGGNRTDFSLSLPSGVSGVSLSTYSGTTPSRVSISVDPTAFQTSAGTTVIPLSMLSSSGVNIPPPVTLLVNTRQPEQKGAIVNVPGKIVDMLADIGRDYLYLVRQDTNELLVFRGSTQELLKRLPTGNTPVQLAMTLDRRYLLAGNDNSQYINVYDLDSLTAAPPVILPLGLYPRTIAVLNGSIWATTRAAGGPHKLVRVDFANRTVSVPEWLGVFKNDINLESIVTASPSGSRMYLVMPDGNVVLYDADYDAFAASRKDETTLGGGYASLDDSNFAVDSTVFNRSLVPYQTLQPAGASSGLAAAGGSGWRVTSASLSSPGLIEKIDLGTFRSIAPKSLAESPVVAKSLFTTPVGQIGQSILPFARTIAPMADGTMVLVRSVSGLTVVPWNYDAALPAPVVDQVVNLADYSTAVAPGGLIQISGRNFSAGSESARDLPLPTSLAGICATVNNTAVPLFAVSGGEIRAQLPFEAAGASSLVIHATGGTSTPFSFNVLLSAMAIFHSATAGPVSNLPAIYRAANGEPVTLTNPVRPSDTLVIYATGLGQTNPPVQDGYAAPADPLAIANLVPTVTLAGRNLQVWFAGLVPGMVGVYQMNVAVPPKLSDAMSVPLVFSSGSYQTTLPVRVVTP